MTITYLIPTPERALLTVTQADDPEQFKAMERAAMEMIPIAQIAHLTFYDTFHLLDNSRDYSSEEMAEAGTFLVLWLAAQEARFGIEQNKETK